MSACSFSIPFSGSPENIYNKVKSAVQGQGGTFNGDASGGNFAVSAFGNNISGSYTVSGQNINVTITDKPFLLSCGMIEGFLKSQLNS